MFTGARENKFLAMTDQQFLFFFVFFFFLPF